ncbi:MAG: polysulfide reductase NrfD [Verrucomicrobia bacterium]|nr:polysulfide reductase NrfD [Verrucomicrobiota bacterium]
MRDYLTFLWRVWRVSWQGSWKFYAWMIFLSVLVLVGVNAWARQFVQGLATTGMTDQVSWGAYIANFTFLVGVAAAAVMLVIPAYIYKKDYMHEVVLFGELMAIAAIVMCLLFVTVDLGHPERFHHMIPPFGIFNFPGSILSWDVIVLNGYLLLNLHIAGYMLYCRYRGTAPTKKFYIPFVFLSIAWAVSIHTVTAFLYVGLAGRAYWHHPLVPARFLASAFVAGPALMILAFQIIRRVMRYDIGDKPIFTMRMIMTVLLRPARPQRPGAVDLDGHCAGCHWAAVPGHAPEPPYRRAEHRLRDLFCGDLDREGHGADHPRLCAVAAGPDCGIPADPE